MSQPAEISEAIRLNKAGKLEESRQALREFLLREPANLEALLWLARVSPDEREAGAAAELALALQPENEVAKRAVEAVHARVAADGPKPPRIDVVRFTGLTLTEARAVVWPFKGYHRPIGVLLDEGKIGLTDLGYAIQNAYRAQVKKAAHTLLLGRLLGEAIQEPVPLKVFGGQSHAAREERKALVVMGAVLGYAVLFLLFDAAYVGFSIYGFVTRTFFAPWFVIASVAALLVLVLGWFGITRIGNEFAERADNYRAGAEGERRASDTLQAVLRGPWALFRNVEWPQRRWGDVDLILVGPGGVWAFEVKAYSGRVRNRGDEWQYESRRGWRHLSQPPGRQARRNAQTTRNYLNQHGVPVKWVDPVVLWAGSEQSLTVEDPAVRVWRLSEVPEQVDELWKEERLSSDQVQKCTTILRALVAEGDAG